jgi:hypothetical protein
MRYSYHCPYCDQRSTRRWNLDVHIKRKHGGHLLGRSSGPNNPLFDRNNVQFGHATVTDSLGDAFAPTYLRRQAPLTSQYNSSPILRTPPSRMDEKYGTGLSQDNIVKIEELKRLMNKHPQYHPNPEGIIRLLIFNSINGDNTPLDQKLEQLRFIDLYQGQKNLS